jgi:hypothetical protein
VSPVDAPVEAPKGRFTCLDCGLQYRSIRELKRHRLKHSEPRKNRCCIVGCMKTFHRSDAIMRVHVKAHERLILKEEQELTMNLDVLTQD